MRLTRRQHVTLTEYRPGYVTQRELGAEFGISQSAVAQRLRRARRRLGIERPRAMPRVKARPVSLSAIDEM